MVLSRTFRVVLAAVVAAVSAGVAAPTRAQISSTFDADLDGWTVVGDNEASWCCGSLDIDDLVTGTANLGSAPPKFLGDWSGASTDDTLRWSIYFSNTSGGTLVTPPHMVRIAGPGGDARGIVPGVVPNEDSWEMFDVAIDPANWTIVSGTWADLIENVQLLELYAEFVSGDEDVRLDNVELSFEPSAVVSACVVSDFNDGTLGSWSLSSSGGTSNPSDDGNSAGYLRIDDGAGSAYAHAPAKFLGDWSAYDGAGSFTVDVRIIARSGANQGSPDFVRLSGPGGSATVSLTADELPVGGQVWHTYEFPLQASEWTIESGSWPAILAEVAECRIDVEFFDSIETIGIDNVGRRLDDCPSIDAPVVVHDPTMSLVRTIGFVDGASAARNPVDGRMYAIVREQISNGGGFYAATGDAAGVRVSGLSEPAQLIVDDDGDAFVSLDFTASIQRVPLGGTAETWASGFHPGDDDLFGLAFAPIGFDGPNVDPGDLVITDLGFGGVDEIWTTSPDVAEGERRLTPDPGPDANWYGISDGPAGTMWVADALSSNTLYELRPDGSLVAQSVSLALPRALRYSSLENAFYVFDVAEPGIHRLDATTWASELVVDGFRGVGSAAVSLTADEMFLVVVDVVGDRIYEFALPTIVGAPGLVSVVAPPRAAPNPFRSETVVTFDLDRPGRVGVDLFDVSGRLVRRLADREWSVGAHRLRIAGSDIAPGVYFVRIATAGVVASGRVVRVR